MYQVITQIGEHDASMFDCFIIKQTQGKHKAINHGVWYVGYNWLPSNDTVTKNDIHLYIQIQYKVFLWIEVKNMRYLYWKF